jgi:putative endonuclease
MWFVYILECQNGEFYTGITDNIERRFIEHQRGKGGKFTRDSGVRKLLHQESFSTVKEARDREVQIKGWTRRKKLALIAGDKKRLKEI